MFVSVLQDRSHGDQVGQVKGDIGRPPAGEQQKFC